MAGAQTAWRCTQCGAVNEPGARACRECGKWPSLFDLQASVEEEPKVAYEDELEPFEVETFESETFERGTFEAESFEPETFEPENESDGEPAQPRWKSILSGVVVPLALVVYFLLSFLSDR